MSRYAIDIVTMRVKNGKTIKPLTPDKDGVFRGVPAFVLGKASRNAEYDYDALYKSIVAPTSTFQLRIKEGNCEGEFGHPFLSGSNEDQIRRLFFIDRTRTSHTLLGVHSKELEGGITLGTIDIKPSGPHRSSLEESLMDPNINTAFSMRTFCHPAKKLPDGRLFKTPREFITIDSEGTPGWEEASKRWADTSVDGMECINRVYNEVSNESIISVIRDTSVLGFESKNNQLFDLLCSDQVTIDKTRYIVDRNTKSMVDSTGSKSDIFHTMFGGF